MVVRDSLGLPVKRAVDGWGRPPKMPPSPCRVKPGRVPEGLEVVPAAPLT